MFADSIGGALPSENGKRIVGQAPPHSQPGTYTTADFQLNDWGSVATIDSGDGYAYGIEGELDRDSMGVRMSLSHAIDFLDLRASEVLTASSTPWTTSDIGGSDWGSNSPLTDIQSALDSYESTTGVPMPVGRIAMVVGSKTYRDLQQSTHLMSLWATSGFGQLTYDQLLAALGSIGVSELYYGSDARYSSYCSLYIKPTSDLAVTPGGRMAESAGIITPHAGAQLFNADDEPDRINSRQTGYYVYANCEPCGILPDFGVRITGISS